MKVRGDSRLTPQTAGASNEMGIAAITVGLATLGFGGYRASRRGFGLQPGMPAALGGLVLAWTWLTLGTLGLGLAGWFNAGALLAWSAAGLMAALIVTRGRAVDAPSGGSREPYEPLGLAAIVALGLTLWAVVVMAAPSVFYPVKVVSDGPIYHLYFAARWRQAGRIFLVATPFGESAAPYFPAVGDLWLAWLFVVGGGDRVARVGQLPFAIAAVATVYALARRLGSRRPAALVASAWFATVMPFFVFSFEPNVDSIAVAGYVLAVYFGAKYQLRDGGVGLLVLAGLSAGAAWGTKAPGIVFVPPLLVLGVVVALARPGSVRTKVRDAAIVLLVPFVLEGYWLARNAWLTGNPLYPLHVVAFGRTWLAGWFGPEAMRTSPYYIPRDDWRAAVDTALAFFDPRLIPLWLLSLLGLWRLGRRRAPMDGLVWSCSGLAVLNLALFWLVIPYRTQARFLIPAAALASIPLARLFDRGRPLLWAGTILIALHILSPQDFPFRGTDGRVPWDLSAAIPNNAPGPVPLTGKLAALFRPGPGSDPASIVASLAIGLGCLGLAVAFGWARQGNPVRHLMPVAGLGLLTFVQAQLIAPPPRAEILYRFPAFGDYLAGWSELDRRTRGGARIAYAGTNLPYYLMGNDFRNEVRYVNVDAHRDWLLHDYHRAARAGGLAPTWPETRPGWDRLQPDYEAWVENLRAEAIDLLVVARVNPDEGRHNVSDGELFPIERVWADGHPERFTRLYSDPLFKVYGVRDLRKSLPGSTDSPPGRH